MGSRVQCKEYPLWSVVIRPAELDDASKVATELDKGDVAELAALGRSPLDSIYEGISVSDPCWTICLHTKPVAVFGLIENRIWLLATPALRKLRKGLLREARWWVSVLHESCRFLHNHIDARQTTHIAWLRALGFTVELDPTPLGVNNEPFLYFWRHSPCVTPSP